FLFLTYYLQTTLGYSAVLTGVAFLPMIVALSITAQLSNVVLMPRLGPRPLVPVGMLVAAAGLVWMTRLGLNSSYVGHVLGPLVVVGLGVGLIFAPAVNVATLGVADHDAGVASALVNTSQQIGGSVGTALLNTLAASAATSFLVGRVASRHVLALAAVHSYTAVFRDTAAIFVVGAVLTGLTLRSGVATHSSTGPALH
ncbi:MAG: MFS transporter, partial [Acidimicrobiales bacterium]